MSRLLCHHSILALPLTPIRLARLENSVQTFSDRYEAGIARAAKQRNDILSSQLAGDPATASYPPLGPIMQALDVYVPLLVFVRDLFEQSKETIFHETFLFHWTSVMSKRKKPFEMFGWQFEMMNVLQLKAIVYGIAAGVEVENAATDALMEVAVKKAVNHLLQAAGLHVYMKERLLKEFEILPKKRPMELLAPSHDVMKHMYVGEAAGVLLHKAKARDMMAAVKAKLATTAFRSFSSSLDALRQLGSEERDFDPSLRRYIKFSASAYLATALIYLAADWIEKEEKDKATSALQLAYAKVTSLSAYARESAKEKEIVSMDFERRHASIMQMWMAHADRVGRDMCEKKVKKEEEEESIISTLPDVVKLSVNEYILPPSAIKVKNTKEGLFSTVFSSVATSALPSSPASPSPKVGVPGLKKDGSIILNSIDSIAKAEEKKQVKRGMSGKKKGKEEVEGGEVEEVREEDKENHRIEHPTSDPGDQL